MRYPNEEMENYRKSAGDLENELIDEYRAGAVTRTRARAARLGARHVVRRCSALVAELPLASAPHRAPGRARPRDDARGLAQCRRLARAAAAAVARRARASRTWRASSSSSPTRTRSCGRGSRRRGRRRTTRRRGRSRSARTSSSTTARRCLPDDVVATFKRLLTKDSQALSSYKGLIAGRQERSATMPCSSTSSRPNGFFPYLTSQQTYQAIILPKSYQLPSDLTKPGEWTSKMNGTGPFKLKENRGAAGFSFEANPNYWGGKPAIDTVDWQILEDQARVDRAPERSDRPRDPAQLPGRPAGRRARRRSRCGRRTTGT